jgi:hypothetical protein
MSRERKDYPTFLRPFSNSLVGVVLFGKDPDQNHESVRFEFPNGTIINGISFHGSVYWKNWEQLGKWNQLDVYLHRDGTLDDVTNGIRDKIYKFCQAFLSENLSSYMAKASQVALWNKARNIENSIEEKLGEIEKLREEVEVIDNSLNISSFAGKS